MIFVGQAVLCRALIEYTDHYQDERNRQGPDNTLNRAELGESAEATRVCRRQRLGMPPD